MKLFLLAAWMPFFAGCQKKATTGDTSISPVGVVLNPVIKEASGIADSRNQPGALWVIEDSGNPPQLILLGHDGQTKKKLLLRNATNRDWEDVVLANGHLYIGDIGDNDEAYGTYKIYKLPEPASDATGVETYETIRFRYADKPHDAEAFLVEPETGDIYLITKRDAAAQVFKIAYPYSLTEINIAQNMGQLAFTNVVSAAISTDGRQVLVKTYGNLYQFSREPKEALAAVLKKGAKEAPYQKEPQGEAVCFRQDGTGYFTLSELLFGKDVQLFFYKIKL